MSMTLSKTILAVLGTVLVLWAVPVGLKADPGFPAGTGAAADAPILAAGYEQPDLAPFQPADLGGCISLTSSTLVGDINGDGYVNVADLQLLVLSWDKAYGNPGFNTEADLNCDGYINVGDLQILVANWGTL